MYKSSDDNLKVAIIANLVVFSIVPTVAIKVFHASYVSLGLSFMLASLLQALIPPRKGVAAILTISLLFTLAALILERQGLLR